MAAVGIHGCHTEVDIEVLLGAHRGAALIQRVAKVKIPCMESEIEGTDIYGQQEMGKAPWIWVWEMASYSPMPAAADTVTQ